MEWSAFGAAIIAALFVLVDLDQFYTPKKLLPRLQILAWKYGWVIGNAILAGIVYTLSANTAPLTNLDIPLRMIIIGLGYLAVVQSKIGTIPFNEARQPLGLELGYDSIKQFVYRRINKISRSEIYYDVLNMVEGKSLDDLTRHAHMSVDTDALLNIDKKRELNQLIMRTYDGCAQDLDKKVVMWQISMGVLKMIQ